jgi:hypothetical protein
MLLVIIIKEQRLVIGGGGLIRIRIIVEQIGCEALSN